MMAEQHDSARRACVQRICRTGTNALRVEEWHRNLRIQLKRSRQLINRYLLKEDELPVAMALAATVLKELLHETRAVVVAQLAEQSLPTPEIRGLNPNMGNKIFKRNYLSIATQKRLK